VLLKKLPVLKIKLAKDAKIHEAFSGFYFLSWCELVARIQIKKLLHI